MWEIFYAAKQYLYSLPCEAGLIWLEIASLSVLFLAFVFSITMHVTRDIRRRRAIMCDSQGTGERRKSLE